MKLDQTLKQSRIVLTLLLLGLTTPAHSQSSEDISLSVPPPGTLDSIALQPDGKILVVGAFPSLGGQRRNEVTRLNQDGSFDETFNLSQPALWHCLSLQDDGKILAGGVGSPSAIVLATNS